MSSPQYKGRDYYVGENKEDFKVKPKRFCEYSNFIRYGLNKDQDKQKKQTVAEYIKSMTGVF